MPEYKAINVNAILISGNLANEPELKYTPSGKPICRFRLASNIRFKDATNSWKEETTFIPVIVAGPHAERISETLNKGYAVVVEGSLRERRWEDQTGIKHSICEIVAKRVQNLTKSHAQTPDNNDEINIEETASDLPF